MSHPFSQSEHEEYLRNAFEKDGYTIARIINESGRTGIVAEHKTAVNYDTGVKKKVYYVEGSHYEMGYLIGLLAEEEVAAMAVSFTEKIAFAFLGSKRLDKMKPIQEALVYIVYELAKGMYPTLPQDIRYEIQGIFDGCKKSNPATKVSMENLIALNMGIDVLCAMVYTGRFLKSKIPEIRPYHLRIPVFCNGFSVFGGLAGNGHYFGRDFMFPTAQVFQDQAAMIIYNSLGENGKKTYPLVSVTAPGLVGSIAAMNSIGVGIGVDMSPGANCNPQNVGLNSLLLNRVCAQHGDSADRVVAIIKGTVRGVSWNYIIADGANDKACIVEAGSSSGNTDFFGFTPRWLRQFLPDADFIRSCRSAEIENGMVVRWSDYRYPSEYLDFNDALWSKSMDDRPGRRLYTDAFDENGYINKTFKEKNCPSTFYFAPRTAALVRISLNRHILILPPNSTIHLCANINLHEASCPSRKS